MALLRFGLTGNAGNKKSSSEAKQCMARQFAVTEDRANQIKANVKQIMARQFAVTDDRAKQM